MVRAQEARDKTAGVTRTRQEIIDAIPDADLIDAIYAERGSTVDKDDKTVMKLLHEKHEAGTEIRHGSLRQRARGGAEGVYRRSGSRAKAAGAAVNRLGAAVIRLGVMLLLACGPAATHAASFDCGQARTPTERMICADPGLSAQDARLAETYRDSRSACEAGGEGGGAMVAELAAAQRAWLGERDACADAACLRDTYARQIAILEFRPRPGQDAPANRWAGRYAHGGFIEVWIQVRDDRSVRVAISGADPTASRWTCGFAGQARPDSVALDVSAPAALTIRRAPEGVEVPDTKANQQASEASCGLNGSLVWHYAQVPSAR